MVGVGFAGAFLGGALALLSPCSVMLLPAFFSYAFSSPGKLLSRTGIFYLGLAATLVPLGVLSGAAGAWLTAHTDTVITVAAVIVLVLGVVQLSGLPLPNFIPGGSAEGTSPFSVFLLGTVYGLAGGCAGPIFGAVLTMAAMHADPLHSGLLLAVYGAGMTLPLLLLAFFWSRFERTQSWMRPRVLTIGRWENAWTQIIGGLLAIAIGVWLLLTKGTGSFGILSAKTQAEAEYWAQKNTSGVPDWAFLAGAAILLAAIFGVNYLRKRKAKATSGFQIQPSISVRQQSD